MKIIVEFDLENIEDKVLFEKFMQIEEVFYVIDEIKNFLRNLRKYQSTLRQNGEKIELKTDAEAELFDLIDEGIWEFLADIKE